MKTRTYEYGDYRIVFWKELDGYTQARITYTPSGFFGKLFKTGYEVEAYKLILDGWLYLDSSMPVSREHLRLLEAGLNSAWIEYLRERLTDNKAEFL